MKNKIDKKLILHISLLLLCLLVLSPSYSINSTQAQINCPGGPPTWGNPPSKNAWLPATKVSVVIFDTPDPDFGIISDAIRKWNAYSPFNCSNVTFKEAVRATFPYETGQSPPANTIWITRPRRVLLEMERVLIQIIATEISILLSNML